MNRNKVLDFIYFIIRAIYTIFLFLLYTNMDQFLLTKNSFFFLKEFDFLFAAHKNPS